MDVALQYLSCNIKAYEEFALTEMCVPELRSKLELSSRHRGPGGGKAGGARLLCHGNPIVGGATGPHDLDDSSHTHKHTYMEGGWEEPYPFEMAYVQKPWEIDPAVAVRARACLIVEE